MALFSRVSASFLFASAILLISDGVQSQTTVIGSQPGTQTCSCETACSAPGVAQYDVTIVHSWPISTYQIPPSAHWSWMVAASHSSCFVMWRNGTTATRGIELMAEEGHFNTLLGEVTSSNQQLTSTNGRLIGTATGTDTVRLSVDRNHAFASATSMIAPSPDWFVGVDSIPLCSGNQWIDSVTYNLYPWDAGTDSGLQYQAGNINTIPRQPIVRIRPTTSSRATDLFQSQTSDASVPMSKLTFRRTSANPSGSVKAATCPQCSSTQTCRRSYDVLADTREVNTAPTLSTGTRQMTGTSTGSAATGAVGATDVSATTSSGTMALQSLALFASSLLTFLTFAN